ncbi:sigma-70 family RNA polymerase sigma factor [Xanthobacteraceae bacterium A53D]
MTMRKPDLSVIGELAALRRYARTLTRSDTDAEDLVHDALVRAYEKRDAFQKGRNLRVWLMSILHNLFIDGRRARKAEAERVARAADLRDTAQAPSQDHHMRLAQVRDAFMELPEEQREALHLVAIEGLTFADAAKALDIPMGTLMSRLARARAALREMEEGGSEGRRKPNLRIVGGSDEPAR